MSIGTPEFDDSLMTPEGEFDLYFRDDQEESPNGDKGGGETKEK